SPGPGEEARVYSVTLTGAGPTTITATGYVLRNGVAIPAGPVQLASSDVAAQRSVRLQVTASGSLGGAAAPGTVGTGARLPRAVPGNVRQANEQFAVPVERQPRLGLRRHGRRTAAR